MYHGNAKLCYMDTDSFTINIKTKDVYEDIANNAEKRFYTLHYEDYISLPTVNNIKVIGFVKDQLGGNIMTEFVVLRPKTYTYLVGHGSSDKK